MPINSADEQSATLQVMDAMTDLGVFISEAKRKLEEQAALFKRMDVRLSLCLGLYHLPASLCSWVKLHIYCFTCQHAQNSIILIMHVHALKPQLCDIMRRSCQIGAED